MTTTLWRVEDNVVVSFEAEEEGLFKELPVYSYFVFKRDTFERKRMLVCFDGYEKEIFQTEEEAWKWLLNWIDFSVWNSSFVQEELYGEYGEWKEEEEEGEDAT